VEAMEYSYSKCSNATLPTGITEGGWLASGLTRKLHSYRMYDTKPRSSDPPPKNIALDYRAFRIAGHDRQFAHVRCRKGVAVVDQHYENGKRVASDT